MDPEALLPTEKPGGVRRSLSFNVSAVIGNLEDQLRSAMSRLQEEPVPSETKGEEVAALEGTAIDIAFRTYDVGKLITEAFRSVIQNLEQATAQHQKELEILEGVDNAEQCAELLEEVQGG